MTNSTSKNDDSDNDFEIGIEIEIQDVVNQSETGNIIDVEGIVEDILHKVMNSVKSDE